jgi:cyclic-di-GMP-binding protein
MVLSDFLPAAEPRLADLNRCEDWLARAALAGMPHACSALLTLLEEIEANPPRHPAYLQILERLRYPVMHAEAEQAKGFAGKPLPLNHSDAAAFAQANGLWAAMLRAYGRLLSAALNGKHPELEPSLARLFQRVLACAGETIGTCVLARREFGADYWKLIHQAYAAAEARGIRGETVADLSIESSPMAAYVEVLMLQLAQPHRLSHRELDCTRKWVRLWAHKAVLSREAPWHGCYAVDLARASGPAWAKAAADSATLRFLDLDRVASSISTRIQRLEEGAEPAALGLGSDFTRFAAQDLLKTLQRAWLESAPERDFPRRASPSPMELVSGFAAIHHAIEGTPVAKSASPSSYSYGEAVRFHTFQPSAEQDAREQGLETWETLGESDDGFRLRRGTYGMRLAHRQLVALRPGGARRFILCHVDWLIEGPDQTLTIGARALKGEAKACAVRSSDRSAPKRSDALMLPVAPGLSPALLLPTGLYRRAGELELELGNAIKRVTLAGLLEHGFDYDRVRVSTS